MSAKTKAGWAVGLSLVALGAGAFLSGYLLQLLLGLHGVPLNWDTYWSYARVLDLPQIAPFATRIKFAGGIGFGLPMLALLAAMLALLKPREAAFHGEELRARDPPARRRRRSVDAVHPLLVT